MKKFFSKFLSGLVIFSFSFFSTVTATGPQERITANIINLVENCDSFADNTAGNAAIKDFPENDFNYENKLNFVYLGKEDNTEPTTNVVTKEDPDNNIKSTLTDSNVTKKQNNIKYKSLLTALSIFLTSLILKGAYKYLKSKYLQTVNNDLTFHAKNAVNSNVGNEETFHTKEGTKDGVVQKKVDRLATNKKDTNDLDADKGEEEIETKKETDDSLNKDVRNEEEKNKDLIKDDNISDDRENDDDNLKYDEESVKDIKDITATQDSSKLNLESSNSDEMNINKNTNSAFMYSFIKKISIFLAIVLAFEAIGHLLFQWKTKDATAVIPYDQESDEFKSGSRAYRYAKKIIGFWPFSCKKNLSEEKDIKDYIDSFDKRWVDVLFWKPLFGFFGTCRNGAKVNIQSECKNVVGGSGEGNPAPMPVKIEQ